MSKILLLDDDRSYRGIIERVLLSSYPHAITSVGTEAQALEELSKWDFDLVLLDLYIDGRRCWSTLKMAVNHPGDPIAIVFSCEDTRENVEYALSHGAYAFLSKPFEFVRLKKTIDSALNEKIKGRPSEPESAGRQ
ncbi:MAG: response regulator [Syntrophaceae bacterium]